MALTYNPLFHHPGWVDNVDRVRAGGDNGFNFYFSALEAEFNSLATIVSQIGTALDNLSAVPPALQLRLTITPALVATAGVGWGHRSGFAEKVAGQTTAAGMTSVQLPHGSRVKALRATGRNTGAGDLRISLFRQRAADPNAAAERIARVDGAGDPFDATTAADPAFELTDTEHFKHYIVAQLNNAQAADVVSITSFQVLYQTA